MWDEDGSEEWRLLPRSEVTDPEEMDFAMNFFLGEYNEMTSKPMSLVLFQNAIEHVSRITRVIQQPYGNALLMGVGGSGRKSLSTLAASISEYKLKSIEISKSYGRVEWGEDLKKIFKSAGEAGEPTVFLFDDTQIVYESFLEDINLILNTGEVPNLYANDELMAVYDSIGKDANAAGINTGNMSEMYKYFVGRCRTNLHVVLCMSPVGAAARRRSPRTSDTYMTGRGSGSANAFQSAPVETTCEPCTTGDYCPAGAA